MPAEHISLLLKPSATPDHVEVHATIAGEEEVIRTKLATVQELSVAASTVDVRRVGFSEDSSTLVCNGEAEAIKGEAFGLFKKFLDLKSAELDLLQELANRAASPSTTCSACEPVQLFSSYLGLSH